MTRKIKMETKFSQNVEKLRQEMHHSGIFRFIRQGGVQMLEQLKEWGVIPEKPKVLTTKKMTERQQMNMIFAVIYQKCLRDAYFFEKFILGEKMIFFWGKETIKGKEYKTLDLVPESLTKKVIVRTDN